MLVIGADGARGREVVVPVRWHCGGEEGGRRKRKRFIGRQRGAFMAPVSEIEGELKGRRLIALEDEEENIIRKGTTGAGGNGG
jgi:hypothetical protein